MVFKIRATSGLKFNLWRGEVRHLAAPHVRIPTYLLSATSTTSSFPRHGKYGDARASTKTWTTWAHTGHPATAKDRGSRVIASSVSKATPSPPTLPFAHTHRPPHPPARTRDTQATDRQRRAQLPPPPRTSLPSRRHHLNTDTAISTPLNCHHLNSRHTCRTASTATTAATNHHPMPATPPPRQPARAAATSTAAITTADHHPPATPPPQQPNPPQQPTNPVLPPPPHPAQLPWPDLVPLVSVALFYVFISK
ncbi:hypothetical protein EDB84DRAFT_1442689 [Lactarius hengduanensis]|nr:hypothetical protein EDB84DRAFT_1442689 [Lactarius hengduanensis]